MTKALLAALLLALAQAAPAQDAQAPAKDFSAAEKLLFMTNQLGNVRPPATLRYAFRKSGSYEPGFDDKVAIVLTAGAGGACCAAHTDFLSGDRRLPLPDLAAAEGNPVILHFLERDVREMQRLTSGSQNHFRKQLRMAIYGGATVRDVSLRYRGREIAGREIAVAPYADDPNRPRFEKLARKDYRFVLSDAVPGGVYAIRTRISDPAGAALIVEELLLEGAETSP